MLKLMYEKVEKRIKNIVFDTLWKGFERFDFALYNDTEAIINGEICKKPEAFLANTALFYEERYIAIWYLVEEMDADILTSKIIHEMFHAFQNKMQESRFPNEIEAICHYKYSSEYLQIKYNENKLLADLVLVFDEDKLKEFLSYRKLREVDYPYQYHYENMIEVIEGSAKYVEIQVLKALDEEKYINHLNQLVNSICKVENMIPIRIISYTIGALFLNLCIQNHLPAVLTIGNRTEGFFELLIKKVSYQKFEISPDVAVINFYKEDVKKLQDKIEHIILHCREVIKGDFELLGFNVYSARYMNDYIYSQYFVMYKDREPVTLYGNYLLKFKNNRVTEIYKE